MPRFSAIERERIYQNLLREGESLFNQRGLEAVTAEEIAKECGIAKGSFYHFFQNKEHLYMIINNQLQEEIFQGFQQQFEKNRTEKASEQFYQAMLYLMERFLEHPLIMGIDQKVWERLEKKAPAECMEENRKRDLACTIFFEKQVFSFRYDLETVMRLLQIQFVQLAFVKETPQDIEIMKIMFQAVSEHLVKEETE